MSLFKSEYVETHVSDISVYKDRTQVGDLVFITANNFKKYVPIEWIKKYARHKASKGFTEIDCYWQSWEEDVLKMVADWEKENE